MSRPTDLRHYANWYRSLGKSTRRNRLDDFADEIDGLRREVKALRRDQATLIERAAHEAWLRAQAGGSPDEIRAAVHGLKRHG